MPFNWINHTTHLWPLQRKVRGDILILSKRVIISNTILSSIYFFFKKKHTFKELKTLLQDEVLRWQGASTRV